MAKDNSNISVLLTDQYRMPEKYSILLMIFLQRDIDKQSKHEWIYKGH